MKTIVLLHPFTPQAAGVVEKSVAAYHSQPHLKALQSLAESMDVSCRMEYFTSKWSSYSFLEKQVDYRFYPVDFKWNGDHKKWKKQTSKSCLRAYKKNTPDVTIINMSGHSSPFSHQLAKIISANKKRYIAMLGGQHYSDTPANREYYKNAHHILVHTNLQKREMETLPLFKDLDIRVFPLGVDCGVFTPKEKQSRAPQLLYVGRIVELKRIHLAIEALRLLKNNGFPKAHLKIIGPVFSEAYFSELKDMVKNSHLETNVSFLGHKSHAELPTYFQETDLFTLPSDKETFGMVMIEAMACGTPVAGMDCPGGPADVITHLKDGLLTTPETYGETILEYFRNPALAKTMEAHARQKVLEEYSIQATFRVLQESVNSALFE